MEETHRALAHGAIDQGLHLTDLFRIGEAVGASHDFAAYAVMAHQRRYVDAEAEFVEFLEPGGEVQLRTAAVARDDRGDAIEQEVIGARIALHVAFHVSVGVDEARRQYALAGVDDARGGGLFQAAYGGDASILHRDIGAEPGVAAAIDHARVADQNVVVGCLRGERKQEEEKIFGHRKFHYKRKLAAWGVKLDVYVANLSSAAGSQAPALRPRPQHGGPPSLRSHGAERSGASGSVLLSGGR